MDIVSYSEARNNLKAILDRVVANHLPTVIFRQKGQSVVLISKEEYDRLNETEYLQSSPANDRRLREAMVRMDAGKGEEHELIDP